MIAVASYLGAASFWLVGSLSGEVLKTSVATIEAPAVALLGLVIVLNLAAAIGWRASASLARWIGGAASILNTAFLHPQAPYLGLRFGPSLVLVALVVGQTSWWIFNGRGPGSGSLRDVEQPDPRGARRGLFDPVSLVTRFRPLWMAAFAAAAVFWPIVAVRRELFELTAPSSVFGLGFVGLAIILNLVAVVIVAMSPSRARQAYGVLAIVCNVVPFSPESPLGTLLIGPTITVGGLVVLQIAWAFLYDRVLRGR